MKAVVFHEHGGPEVLRYEDVRPRFRRATKFLSKSARHQSITSIFFCAAACPASKYHFPGLKVGRLRYHPGNWPGRIGFEGRPTCDHQSGNQLRPLRVLHCGFRQPVRFVPHCRRTFGRCVRGTGQGSGAHGVADSRFALFRRSRSGSAGLPYGVEHDGQQRQYPTRRRCFDSRRRRRRRNSGNTNRENGRLPRFRNGKQPGKVRAGSQLGADFLINYKTEEFDKRIRDLTNKRGVDVVVDYIGADTWVRSLRSARRGGRVLTCGATTGFAPQTDLRQIFFRQVQVFGSTMGSHREFLDVMKCIFRGQLKPVIDSVLPLKEARKGHELIEQRAVFGKIVLTPQGE